MLTKFITAAILLILGFNQNLFSQCTSKSTGGCNGHWSDTRCWNCVSGSLPGPTTTVNIATNLICDVNYTTTGNIIFTNGNTTLTINNGVTLQAVTMDAAVNSKLIVHGTLKLTGNLDVKDNNNFITVSSTGNAQVQGTLIYKGCTGSATTFTVTAPGALSASSCSDICGGSACPSVVTVLPIVSLEASATRIDNQNRIFCRITNYSATQPAELRLFRKKNGEFVFLNAFKLNTDIRSQNVAHEFIDASAGSCQNKCEYEVQLVEVDGTVILQQTVELLEKSTAPEQTQTPTLIKVWPSPVAKGTVLNYQIPKFSDKEQVIIRIHNILGKNIAVSPVDKEAHQFLLPDDLTPGIYFMSIQTGTRQFLAKFQVY